MSNWSAPQQRFPVQIPKVDQSFDKVIFLDFPFCFHNHLTKKSSLIMQLPRQVCCPDHNPVPGRDCRVLRSFTDSFFSTMAGSFSFLFLEYFLLLTLEQPLCHHPILRQSYSEDLEIFFTYSWCLRHQHVCLFSPLVFT